MEFGKYQFLSWARRGIARNIIEKDLLGKQAGSAIERAKIPIAVKINNSIHHKRNFAIIGPGDVIGIQPKMIIRTDPLDGISDFEPNLLPYIEFYDEDFPWRYTPASPGGLGDKHLRPWLALIVLKENEFVDTERRQPLSSIKIESTIYLPPADQLHLWAHMHSNLPHEQDDFENFLDSLEQDVKSDPDGVYSRLICQRKLEARTLYHAFLVPSYETGRLAGLGRPVDGVSAQQHSFGSDLEFPIYHRWYFRTGENFDFEYLVKLLKPRAMDERVGQRPMDCSEPAFVQANVDEKVSAPKPNILLLEGAMKAPNAVSTVFPPTSTPQPFFNQLEDLLNLNLVQQENPDEDPFVTVPYYGMYHSVKKNNALPGKKEILPFQASSNKWYNDLNRDPRTRVPAGFGARVVQQNQEKFMDKAWEQLGEILKANRKMKLLQFNTALLTKTYEKYINFREADGLLGFTAKLNAKILHNNITIKSNIHQSRIPNQILQYSFTKLIRKNSVLNKNLNIATISKTYSKITKGLNQKNGLTIIPKNSFKEISEIKNVGNITPPSSVVQLNVWSTQSNLDKDYIFNVKGFQGGLPDISKWEGVFELSAVLADRPDIIGDIATIPDPIIVAPLNIGVILNKIPNNVLSTDKRRSRNSTRPPIVVDLPKQPTSPVFNQPADSLIGQSDSPADPVIGKPGTPTGPVIGQPGKPTGSVIGQAGPDTIPTRDDVFVSTAVADNALSLSQQNTAMKKNFANVNFRMQFSENESAAPALSYKNLAKSVTDKIQPHMAFKAYKDYLIKWPDESKFIPKEEFIPAMAYPDFPEPVYKYLTDIDEEFLLPNLKLIPPNTLSLLKTNQKFIEAYLMGLNYEMGKELMWREFPTDMRGSYFRQFWDVNGLVKPNTEAKEADALKDITPIHLWPRQSKLGTHNRRDAKNDTEQLVFVIKGDLLKKFPNTVIYAQKAVKIKGKRKIRTEMTDVQFKKEVRFPLYKAEIKPNIKLLGFDLTINEAAGKSVTTGFGNDKLGWYFVIAEVPGEPHFGMDVNFKPNKPNEFSWNDLSWENFEADLDFVRNDEPPTNILASLPNEKTGKWGRSSADMASILFQRPVMVPIHASEMLDVEVPEIKANSINIKTLLEYQTIKI